MDVKTVEAGVLRVQYQEYGPAHGWPCLMMHGFPYDVHAYAASAPILADAGARVIVPYMRGYGGTSFLSDKTPRSGEQAAFGADLLALMDALGVDRAVIGGYDWGGRGCCVVSALWPDRVIALVSGNSYNIQNIARSMEPAPAAAEAAHWYQYYFHSERGRRGLTENRRDLIRHCWSLWSPKWNFSNATFEQSANAFENPDFVDVVIHSYRHRYGLVAGDPAVAHIETRLTAQPPITIPTITIDGDSDGVAIHSTLEQAHFFTGPHEHRVFSDIGHNIPQEHPADWAQAVLDARAMAINH